MISFSPLKLLFFCVWLFASSYIHGQDLCDRSGISNGWMLDQSKQEMDLITKACAETKSLYFRADFAWSDVQWNGQEEWNWENIDRLLESAQSNNLEMIAILTYFPNWVDQQADTVYWSEFVYRAGLRYIPQGVTIYEMWNEPNISNFFPEPNTKDYVEKILIPGYNAIQKAALELEISITVLTGGLAPAATDGTNISQLDFVKEIYEYGGKNYFDALGQHPYCWPIAPDQESDFNWFLKTVELREVMIDNDDADKLIWGTEMGWPTHQGGNGISEDEQAIYLSKSYEIWNNWEWTGPLIWYSFNDAGNDSQNPEDNFGISNEFLDPKPSYQSWIEMNQACLSTSLDAQDITSVNVYPNPTNGNLFIDTGVPTFKIKLYSTNGIKLLESENSNHLDLSEYDLGMYFLFFEAEGKTQSFKLILF